MSATGKKLTREEELLLQDFSRNVSAKSSALFYGNALIISATPLWLYWRVHQMEPEDGWFFWSIITVLATYLLAFAYKNVKFVMKHKIAQKREDGITREIMKRYAEDKKMTKKEKDERILWKKNEVADYEAATFSIFYNNVLFLMIFLIVSFIILPNASNNINYIVSVAGAAGLVALFSTSTK